MTEPEVYALRYAMAISGVREVSVECDMVDVTRLHEPDTSWRFVDAAGHQHRWEGDWRKASLPTLRLVIDHECDDSCPDEYHGPTSHYECLLCDEVVEPETMPSPSRRFVPGLERLVWR